MFKPANMVKVSALILERDEWRVLQCLGEMGAMQLMRNESETSLFSEKDFSHELARCNHLLTHAAELRKALEVPKGNSMSDASLSMDQAEANLEAMETRAAALLNSRRELTRQLSELAATAEQISLCADPDMPLDGPDAFSFLHFATGSLPVGAVEKLQLGEDVLMLPLSQKNGRRFFIAVAQQQKWAAVENIFQKAGFQSANLPIIAGSKAGTFLSKSSDDQQKIRTQLERVNGDLKKIAAEFSKPLSAIETVADIERRMLEAAQGLSRTDCSILISGWVPADTALLLEQRIQQLTGGHCVVEMTQPRPNEQVPVLLRQPRWLRAFAPLVTAYGLPEYRELEPTLFVAASFVLMFGMMFGDMGQGAVIAFLGLVAWLRGRRAVLRVAGRMMFACGLAGAIFGFVYGSFFGLPSFKKYALWHDPLEGNPLNLMTLAIGFGVVVISVGLVFNIINRFRRRDVIGAVLDKFGIAGLLFYWMSLALFIGVSPVRSLAWPVVAVVLGLLVLGWILKEPFLKFRNRNHERADWFSTISESLVGAFEGLLGFLANTISFVRLAAYAMSHAALLVAVFLLADAVKQIPAAGDVLGVMVIILGNIATIALEAIIASVQALRLEYYEFFSKFFSGDGQPFKPFCLQTKTVAETPF